MTLLRTWLRIKYGPPKWNHLQAAFGRQPFKLLDVGCGNHAVVEARKLFPSCEYYGLDNSRTYNNDESDFKQMKAFYEVDLGNQPYDIIPNEYFDVVVMSHVLEHLPNGLDVLSALAPKLKPKGIFYVEWPHPRSVGFPSMRNCLNFYDDPTHVKLYTMVEVCNTLRLAGLKPLGAKTRRNAWYMAFSPALITLNVYRNRGLTGPDLWDWLGFAQYVLARRS